MWYIMWVLVLAQPRVMVLRRNEFPAGAEHHSDNDGTIDCFSTREQALAECRNQGLPLLEFNSPAEARHYLDPVTLP